MTRSTISKLLAGNPLTGACVFVNESAKVIVRQENGDEFAGGVADATADGQVPTWGEVTAGAWAPSAIAPLCLKAQDWTTFLGKVNAASTANRGVQMGPGAWTCDAQLIQLDSGASLRGHRSTVVSYDCRPVAATGEGATPLWHNVQPATTTTVAVTGVVGQRTLTVYNGLGVVVGDRFRVEDTGKCVRGYEVVAQADAIVMSGTVQLSALTLTGASLSNTDVGKLYVDITKPAAVPVINVYKDAGKTSLVATGTRADDAGGVINLTASGGSGLTGTVTITAAVVPDTTTNFFYAGGSLTLDAPLPYPFPVAATVTVIPLASQCRDIRIDGQGMRFVPDIDGVQLADKLIELYGSWDCVIEDMHLDSSGAVLMACSYDMGGVRNTFRRIVQDGGGSSSNGIALEGQRDGLIANCSTRDNALCGYDLGSCTSSVIEDCVSDHDYYGVYFAALAGDAVGCTHCTVRGVTVRNSASSAVAIGFGASYNVIEGVVTDGCVAGIECGAFTGSASHHNTVKNSTLRGGNNGLVTIDGSHDNLLEGCSLINQTGAAAYLTAGPTKFRACYIESAGASSMVQIANAVRADVDSLEMQFNGGTMTNGCFYLVGASSVLRGRGIKVTCSANISAGQFEVFNMWTGGDVDVGDVDVTFYDNTTSVFLVDIKSGSRFRCNNYKQTNGKGCIVITNATAKVQIDGILDITNIGATGLVSLGGGGATAAQCNVGQLTADGANPTVVAIPQIAAQSVVRIWAPGGVLTQTAQTHNPGVGTTITTILAAGTYFWQLVT